MTDTFDLDAWLAQGRANADKLPEGMVLPPERDWADDVWDAISEVYFTASGNHKKEKRDAINVIRTRCRPIGKDMQHVAYFDEGQFHWMSGIAPRDCELYAKPKEQPNDR